MLITAALALTGCGATERTKDNAAIHEEIVYTSNIPTEDCCLCGDGAENLFPLEWGQNNVALISLNTFEIKPLKINRYSMDGMLIEKHTGTISFGGGESQNGGFSASLMVDTDRGYATGSVCFNDDEILDVEKAAAFLCSDCLNKVISKTYKDSFGVGVINFDTKDIRMLDEHVTGFTLGDFYVGCDL